MPCSVLQVVVVAQIVSWGFNVLHSDVDVVRVGAACHQAGQRRSRAHNGLG